jgi:mannitol/fructose-specific phosphotransferase system IIA component (Ntr-type)
LRFTDILRQVSESISKEINTDREIIENEFLKTSPIDPAFVIPEVSILYAQIPEIKHPALHIVLSDKGISKPTIKDGIPTEDFVKVLFFLVNAEEQPRQQLRMLSGILDIAERDHFLKDILQLKNDQKVIEYLLHDKRYISIQLLKNSASAIFINKRLMEVQLPNNVLVILVERENTTFTPNGKTLLLENDTITIIGETNSINQMYDSFILEK